MKGLHTYYIIVFSTESLTLHKTTKCGINHYYPLIILIVLTSIEPTTLTFKPIQTISKVQPIDMVVEKPAF